MSGERVDGSRTVGSASVDSMYEYILQTIQDILSTEPAHPTYRNQVLSSIPIRVGGRGNERNWGSEIGDWNGLCGTSQGTEHRECTSIRVGRNFSC